MNHENAIRIFYSDFKENKFDHIRPYKAGWYGDYDAVTKSIRVEIYPWWGEEALKTLHECGEKFTKAHGTVIFAEKSDEVPSWNFEDVLMYFKNNGEAIRDRRREGKEELHVNGGRGFGGLHPVGGLKGWTVVTWTYTGCFKFRGVTVEYTFVQDLVNDKRRDNKPRLSSFTFSTDERKVTMDGVKCKIETSTPANVILKFIIRTCKAMEVKHA